MKKDQITDEQRVLDFLKEKAPNGNAIKLNDFLKSFYPPATGNMPDLTATTEANVRFRTVLEKLVAAQEIEVTNNQQVRLGSFYYPTDDGRTHYHSIKDTVIEVKWVGAEE